MAAMTSFHAKKLLPPGEWKRSVWPAPVPDRCLLSEKLKANNSHYFVPIEELSID